MKVIFKNVGQADSLIIEWSFNSEDKYGVIDCAKHENMVPTIEVLRAKNVKEINFIILSHPHFDHCSGLLELLEFCDSENVLIKGFYHTSTVTPSYINYTEYDESSRVKLFNILRKVDSMYNSKKILKSGSIGMDWDCPLTKKIRLRCLSPSDYETKSFTNKVDYHKQSNEYQCSLAANSLSTILKIYDDKGNYILLTSDAIQPTFERLLHKHTEDFQGQILLGQGAHHGSIKNHHSLFWSTLKKAPKCPIAISVGNKYGHPSTEVVNSFSDLDFMVSLTKGRINNAPLALSMISKPVVLSGRDLEYEFSSFNE